MVRMGWTPKRTTDAQGSAAGTPSPAPRRRRKATAEETPAPPMRPPPGKSGKLGDTRSPKMVQVGKRWGQIITEVKQGQYSWADFVEGLDEEELARGQLKSVNGNFAGRPPQLVPREFHLACQRELKRRFQELFDKDVVSVAKTYLALAQNNEVKVETRAKMLQYAMERVFGGIPRDVTIKQEAPWEQVFVNVTGSDEDNGLPDHLKRRYAGYQERLGDTEDPEE